MTKRAKNEQAVESATDRLESDSSNFSLVHRAPDVKRARTLGKKFRELEPNELAKALTFNFGKPRELKSVSEASEAERQDLTPLIERLSEVLDGADALNRIGVSVPTRRQKEHMRAMATVAKLNKPSDILMLPEVVESTDEVVALLRNAISRCLAEREKEQDTPNKLDRTISLLSYEIAFAIYAPIRKDVQLEIISSIFNSIALNEKIEDFTKTSFDEELEANYTDKTTKYSIGHQLDKSFSSENLPGITERLERLTLHSRNNSEQSVLELAKELFPEWGISSPLPSSMLTEPAPTSKDQSPSLPEVAPVKWKDREPGETPVTFIKQHYGILRDGVWDRNGLTKADVRRADIALYNALAQHNRRHPEDSLELPGRTEVSDSWVERVQSGQEPSPADARGTWRLASAIRRKALRERE